LYAILANLVKNAVKYTNEGAIRIGYQLTGEYLKFFVEDTGIGIPRNRQDAIFERFIQADISDKMAMQGAGLGLSITKAYVLLLGGQIWVESEENKGSVFFFTIPYKTETKVGKSDESPELTDETIDHSVSLKILVAEDDESSQMLISHLLRKFSKEIILVKTGTETVEICRNDSEIDLVLMDMQMPGLNGYEATRQIRTFNKEVVIVAQTAYALSGDREQLIQAGCNDYISKPIEKMELLKIISRYFGK